MSIYGRTFHVTGCDAATRAYFEKKGAALVENEAPPMDSYTTYRADRTLRETGRDPTVCVAAAPRRARPLTQRGRAQVPRQADELDEAVHGGRAGQRV